MDYKSHKILNLVSLVTVQEIAVVTKNALIGLSVISGALLFASPVPTAFAQGQGGGVTIQNSGGGGVSDGILASGHIFFYQDQSSLGDEALKDGSATFTRFDLQWNNLAYWSGIGLFYEQDSFGEAQKDQITGLILELVTGSFFFKIMPGAIEQTFTGRSFAKRAGSYLAFEGGIRGNFYGGWMFYEVALHRRTQTISQEDGRDMQEKFSKTETMPMLGGGFTL
jgi:hypothetical protein